MENVSKLNRVVLALLLTCSTPISAGLNPGRAADFTSASSLPFTSMAIQVANLNLVPADSVELRISGLYGLNYQAFLQDIQNVELVAIATYGLGGTELSRSDHYAEVEKIVSLVADARQMTQTAFDEAQKKFLTSLSDVQAFRMPDAADEAKLMPKELNNQQLATLERLGKGTGYQDGNCGSCGHTCGQGNAQPACDPEDTQCVADAAKTCESPEGCAADQTADSSCCDCCCCQGGEELALFASGAGGYGAFSAYQAFVGWGNNGNVFAKVETTTETHTIIKVPEPSTYLTIAGMLALASWVCGRARRREQREE